MGENVLQNPGMEVTIFNLSLEQFIFRIDVIVDVVSGFVVQVLKLWAVPDYKLGNYYAYIPAKW